jgi:hypothetical protein
MKVPVLLFQGLVCLLRLRGWAMEGPRYADVERRLLDASQPAYDATRMNRLRAEIGWMAQ